MFSRGGYSRVSFSRSNVLASEMSEVLLTDVVVKSGAIGLSIARDIVSIDTYIDVNITHNQKMIEVINSLVYNEITFINEQYAIDLLMIDVLIKDNTIQEIKLVEVLKLRSPPEITLIHNLEGMDILDIDNFVVIDDQIDTLIFTHILNIDIVIDKDVTKYHGRPCTKIIWIKAGLHNNVMLKGNCKKL